MFPTLGLIWWSHVYQDRAMTGVGCGEMPHFGSREHRTPICCCNYLSSHSSTNASFSLPFLHVKRYPLNPRSTRLQCRSVRRNSSIGAIGQRTPPFFSSEAKISLKSPKQIQGRDARAWRCLISLHVLVLHCSFEWL